MVKIDSRNPLGLTKSTFSDRQSKTTARPYETIFLGLVTGPTVTSYRLNILHMTYYIPIQHLTSERRYNDVVLRF